MLHTSDPFLLHFYGNVGLRWYGLSYILAFISFYFIVLHLSKRKLTPVYPNQILDLITYIAFGTLVGGRLGYCLFYSPDAFIKFSSNLPFWGVLAVNEGGMSSHGGIIGIMIACWLASRKFHIYYLHILDLAAIVAPIGIFLGRIANYVNGELVGRSIQGDSPFVCKIFSCKFPQDILHWINNSPSKLKGLNEIVSQLGVNSEQWSYWISNISKKNHYSEVSNVLRLIIKAVQDGNTKIQELLTPLLTSRHPSQMYAAFLEGLLVFLILFFMWRKPRKPGIITACFGLIYSIARIFGEFFRQPDLHIGFQWLGLTRGQWLTFVLFIASVFTLFIWSKSESLPTGGWRKNR